MAVVIGWKIDAVVSQPADVRIGDVNLLAASLAFCVVK